MRDAVATVLPLARNKGIKVSCEPGSIPRFQADRDKVRQCLVNLCSNAVKFTPAGGAITVSCEALAGDRVALHVADTGIGIPPNERTKLFGRFFRGRAAKSAGVPGSGLGLAISRAIVEAHHGTLELLDRPGPGSTFRVRLPLA
jgi:signal transduction histidine kinase